MSTLNRIRDILKELMDGEVKMEGVYYGACQEDNMEKWNYFVFNRKTTSRSGPSGVHWQTYYEVHIIHEDYIPEGYVEQVVAKLQETDGSGIRLKVTGDNIPYDYTFKGSTNLVVEIATITLTRPEKG